MSSSFSAVFDQYNYFVWPNSSSLSSYQSADTVDALFVTNHSPAYVSSNCTCNGFKSYFTTATPKASFTFGAWGKYSVNGTQVLFDTTIDQSCPSTGDGNICFLTLHNSDGYGFVPLRIKVSRLQRCWGSLDMFEPTVSSGRLSKHILQFPAE
ncbi:hypothetical protein BDZ45DRAFT_394336 [Acephala macrosclerotiorum]|nr:hypothetical protein BDZ45DRAFT_394336 [Acephala macrosclerotiorum]